MKKKLEKRKNKLKLQYHNTDCWYSSWTNDFYYSCPAAYYFRPIRTTNERRAYFLTEDERDAGVKLRASRSIASLPDSWEDIYPSTHDVKKSWKHNSKRRKQWKYE